MQPNSLGVREFFVGRGTGIFFRAALEWMQPRNLVSHSQGRTRSKSTIMENVEKNLSPCRRTLLPPSSGRSE
jgi:hypothetical protein